jgi:hypothetical protein
MAGELAGYAHYHPYRGEPLMICRRCGALVIDVPLIIATHNAIHDELPALSDPGAKP